mgnify:CR=1 FL=1
MSEVPDFGCIMWACDYCRAFACGVGQYAQIMVLGCPVSLRIGHFGVKFSFLLYFGIEQLGMELLRIMRF